MSKKHAVSRENVSVTPLRDSDGVLYRVTSMPGSRTPFVGGILVNDKGIIVETAPILKRFRETHLDHLLSEAKRYSWNVEQL